MKVKKFTDEEISRILSHYKELKCYGMKRYVKIDLCPVGCLNQAAYNEGNQEVAQNRNFVVAMEFDSFAENFKAPKAYTVYPFKNKTADFVIRFLSKIGAI